MAEAIATAHPLLIACLRNEPLDRALNGAIDWPTLLEQAQIHRLLPLLHESLSNAHMEVPAFFKEAAIAQWASSQILAAALESTLALLAEIEVMPLKGPVLAESLYGDIALRPSDDLDLLVRREDFARAESILLQNRFNPTDETDDYHRMFQRNNLIIELHFDLASPRGLRFDVNEIWNRSEPAEFRGRSIRVMSGSDRALYLCLHGLKHGFMRLVWISDVDRALRQSEPEEVFQLAQQQNLELVLFIGCEVVQETLGLPPTIEIELNREPEMAATARRAATLLLEGAIPSINGPEVWSFYLQIEAGTRQRWRRRLSFFTPTVEDYKWAAAARVPGVFAPLVRPFRLLKKHGVARAWNLFFPGRG
jgi:Uncharacterised nucleotidyltransferase